MKKTLITIIVAAFTAISFTGTSQAAPDLFIGDTAIYGGTPDVLQPNVLIILDTSGSMNDAADPTAIGSPFVNTNPYSETANCTDQTGVAFNLCGQNNIYTSSYTFVYDDLNSMPTTTCIFSTGTSTTARIIKTVNPYVSLATTGIYNGYSLNPATGGCCYTSKNIGGTIYNNAPCGNGVYELGNYINWLETNPSGTATKIDIAKEVIGTLVQSTSGVKFGLMDYFYTDVVTVTTTTNNCSWNSNHTKCTWSGHTCVQPACKYVQHTTSTDYNQGEGATFISYPVGDANYETTVKDMDDIFTAGSDSITTYTNRDALVYALEGLDPNGNTPVGESAYEAMRYFQGSTPAFGATIGTTSGTYNSPIEFGCQKNYLIIVTDGMSNADDNAVMNDIKNSFTPSSWEGGMCSAPTYSYCDGTDQNHSVAGVAKYMQMNNMISTSSGTTNVTTFTIGFGMTGATATEKEAIQTLKLAADKNHGNGRYFTATSAQSLSKALTTIISDIFNVATSFVAPVVPLSPENKTYSGNRIYMGFFKPDSSGFWRGNVKKFGLSDAKDLVHNCSTTPGELLDVNGYCATYQDSNSDGYDDRDNKLVPTSTPDGAIRGDAWSYWNTGTGADGANVISGGVGGILMNRNYVINSPTGSITGAARNIYTLTGSTTDLTASSNGFNTGNIANITASTLGLPGPVILTSTTDDVKTLINFVHGFDVYSSTSNTVKRAWVLGDVLHSKPVVVSYGTFTTDPADPNSPVYEKDPAKNKGMIYVGSNDGMLHAFNDYDGSEAWAFIPPTLLPTLQYLTASNHGYFVDSTIKAYVYDAKQDGNITPSDGDKVILVMGMRRGGGTDSKPSTGFYYALDVTDRNKPVFLWNFSNNKSRYGTGALSADTSFAELGETWSEPKMGKINVSISGVDKQKIAMFIGGGYDNCNEDGRFGSTQKFSGNCVNVMATSDGGLDAGNLPITSSGATLVSSLTATSYKGRALYAVELATIPTTTTMLDFSNTGKILWKYTFTDNTNPQLEYSMLSELATVDMNDDGYVDRFYAGDSGGNMWRFDISSKSMSSWNASKIFTSNPGASGYPTSSNDGTNGRKIFYSPSVVKTQNPKFTWVFFGTGDREHPLNRAVTERYYGLIDKMQIGSDNVSELKMLDVSSDVIQEGSDAQVSAFEGYLAKLNDWQDNTYYGWYMRIEGYEHPPDVNNPTVVPAYQGEKVLSPSTVYSNIVMFTTYAPDTAVNSDPCKPGNLGTSRVYALDAKTGMAALNLYGGNDSTYSSSGNKYSNIKTSTGGYVLKRFDRTKNIGSGIASGIIMINDIANTTCGAGLCGLPPLKGGEVLPVYWRQK